MTAPLRFRVPIELLDLDLTLGCGQTFRWKRWPDGSWKGVVGHDVVLLRYSNGRLMIAANPGGHDARERIGSYLRTEDDLAAIQERLSEDEVIARGLARVRGLRLVKMPPWECMVSYVLATNSNIKRIRGMIDTVAERYGDPLLDDMYAFPTIEQLHRATVDELTGCGLGYRAKYIHALCRSVDDDTISCMESLPYKNLRKDLKTLPGIGDKVADCVSLFGFGRLEGFPIDVWVKRALERLYRVAGSYESLRSFAAAKFGPFAGYAQEYLYYNEWCLAPKGNCAFSQQ